MATPLIEIMVRAINARASKEKMFRLQMTLRFLRLYSTATAATAVEDNIGKALHLERVITRAFRKKDIKLVKETANEYFSNNDLPLHSKVINMILRHCQVP